MDSVWEQEKPEARKMLENAKDWASEPQANIAQLKRMSAGQSPASGARFVGRFLANSLMLSNSAPEISN